MSFNVSRLVAVISAAEASAAGAFCSAFAWGVSACGASPSICNRLRTLTTRRCCMNPENLAIPEPSPVVHFDIFTLFPSMFSGPFSESIIKRAQANKLMTAALHNIRTYTTDRHRVCDDTPYGGGGGMV